MLSTQDSRDEEEMGGVLYLTTLPGGLKERLRRKAEKVPGEESKGRGWCIRTAVKRTIR